jgi:ferredoxin--NADP+ reductase
MRVLTIEQSKERRTMSAYQKETVLSVKHWTDSLFSFTATRDPGFRFQNGQFAMIGLEVEGRPLVRAYSMASANHEDSLEFFSIKVSDGPLTSRLQHLREGDLIVMRPKPVGTLVHDALTPGRRLFLFATGTGIAPFASIVRDPETYEKFDQVVLTHTCREVAELAYGYDLIARIRSHEFLPEIVGDKLTHIATTTREASRAMGRMTDWIRDGRLTPSGPIEPATKRGRSRSMALNSSAACRAHWTAARLISRINSGGRPNSSIPSGLDPKVFVSIISAPASK